ncbi:MAG: ABC transporter ATP-binding protein [Myxococcales bacterium]
MPRLDADTLCLAYGDELVVDGMSLHVPVGRTTVLVGPNASGKSTLLKGLCRLLAPKAGAVLLDGKALADWPTRELARHVGYLPQAARGARGDDRARAGGAGPVSPSLGVGG